MRGDLQIHYCYGCDGLHVAGEHTFCQGTFHQCRQSHCAHVVVFCHGRVHLGDHAYHVELARRIQAKADNELRRRQRSLEAQVLDQVVNR